MKGIRFSLLKICPSLAILGLFSGAVAHADNFNVTGSLSATYYTLSESDPDANSVTCTGQCHGTGNLVETQLGPDGLPVYNPNATLNGSNPNGVHDLNTQGEITWWSPAFNPDVTYAGSGTISLPYANSAMFPSGQTTDRNGFLTAEFQGTLTMTAAGYVTFNLQSDDDSFLYVNGGLVVDNGGVHTVPAISAGCCTSLSGPVTDYLNAGTYTINLFYDDRSPVDAVLDFSMTSTAPAYVSPIPTPEPATLSLLLLGFAGLLCVGFRKEIRKSLFLQ